MGAVGAELAIHPQHHGFGLHALELDLAFSEIGLDAIKATEKIVVPECAAELAVGDGFEADIFLLANHRLDLAILNLCECLGTHFPALVPRARLLEGRRPQQASHMIGAKWRLLGLHDLAWVFSHCG
jgi:hypothetical protein